MLAGSGQIRLFLTLVMLEITDQLHLVPFVALAAIVSVVVAGSFSPHGLYHALIHQLNLPYLPLERTADLMRHKAYELTASLGGARGWEADGSAAVSRPDGCSEAGALARPAAVGRLVSDCDGHTQLCCPGPSLPADLRELLVSDAMASPLVTVRRGQSRREVLESVLALETHNGFPVIAEADGALEGILLRSEVEWFGRRRMRDGRSDGSRQEEGCITSTVSAASPSSNEAADELGRASSLVPDVTVEQMMDRAPAIVRQA